MEPKESERCKKTRMGPRGIRGIEGKPRNRGTIERRAIPKLQWEVDQKGEENNSLKVRENRIDGEGNPQLHGEGEQKGEGNPQKGRNIKGRGNLTAARRRTIERRGNPTTARGYRIERKKKPIAEKGELQGERNSQRERNSQLQRENRKIEKRRKSRDTRVGGIERSEEPTEVAKLCK